MDGWDQLRDWITAIGTLGAVAFAAWATVAARLDLRRGQAALVFVVPGHLVYSNNVPTTLEALVYNRSLGPIYDVRVELFTWSWKPGDMPVEARLFAVIAAQSDGGPVPFDPDKLGKPPTTGAFQPPFGLSFTDGQGVRWQRLPDLKLRKAKRRES